MFSLGRSGSVALLCCRVLVMKGGAGERLALLTVLCARVGRGLELGQHGLG
jgi:hypothetical protein